MKSSSMIEERVARFDEQIKALVSEGHIQSGRRLLEDEISDLIRQPFLLHQDIEYLVHYTSISVLFSILNCPINNKAVFNIADQNPALHSLKRCDFLRIYDTFHSNDPGEGKFFVSNIPTDHPIKTDHPELWQWLEDQIHVPAYITSFRGVKANDKIDDLIYWRTYGMDGLGCAIGIPVGCLTRNKRVYQVRYGTDSVTETINYLTILLNAMSNSEASKHEEIFNCGLPECVKQTVWPISYLHKDDHFQFENEVRVVSSINQPDGEVWFEPMTDSHSNLSIRHFANLPELKVDRLLVTGSKIVLGPAVRNSANLKYVLKQRLRNMNLTGPTVDKSTIDYRSEF